MSVDFTPLCTFQTGHDRGRVLSATGPWRHQRGDAEDDCQVLRNAFHSGGLDHLNKAKNELYRTSATAQPPLQDAAADKAEDIPWEIEPKEDGKSFRAVCHFQKTVHYDINSRPIKVMGPYRDSWEKAEKDAQDMYSTFEAGGVPAVQKLKNELFRGAFCSKPAEPRASSPVAGGRSRSRSRSRRRDNRSPSPQTPWPEQDHPAYECTFQVERSEKGHRAVMQLPGEPSEASNFHRNRRGVPLSGPWRHQASQARADGDAVVEAFRSGGAPAALQKKNELFREKTLCRSSTASGARAENVGSHEACNDERVEVVKGGFRAVCKFETTRDTSCSFRRSSGLVSITGPTRQTEAQASEDADELELAYKEDGITAAHKARNDIFKAAFQGKPCGSNSGEDGGQSKLPLGEVEADRPERGWGYRAACQFPPPRSAEDVAPFNKNVASISVIGPWRTCKDEAEADKAALLDAFDEGGTEAAMSLKAELRRGSAKIADGIPAAAVVTDKLSKDELEDKYGKGFLLAKRMGYAGAGLGREEQGREMPVTLDGARTAVGVAARLGLGKPGESRHSEMNAAESDGEGRHPTPRDDGWQRERCGGIAFQSAGLLGDDFETGQFQHQQPVYDQSDREDSASDGSDEPMHSIPRAPTAAHRMRRDLPGPMRTYDFTSARHEHGASHPSPAASQPLLRQRCGILQTPLPSDRSLRPLPHAGTVGATNHANATTVADALTALAAAVSRATGQSARSALAGSSAASAAAAAAVAITSGNAARQKPTTIKSSLLPRYQLAQTSSSTPAPRPPGRPGQSIRPASLPPLANPRIHRSGVVAACRPGTLFR